jgi:hypothetical protein
MAKNMSIKVKKGALHKELGVAEGKKIPAKKLAKAKATAKKTGNTKLAKRVQFAENAKKWKKK